MSFKRRCSSPILSSRLVSRGGPAHLIRHGQCPILLAGGYFRPDAIQRCFAAIICANVAG